MKHTKNVYLFCLTVLLILGSGSRGQAQQADPPTQLESGRPPQGYARPPIHIRGNAATGPRGLTPAQTRHAYGFDQISNQGAGQIIGIVDAYDDPNIESDLAVFNSTFGLPPCTTANGCFQKVYPSGKPRPDGGWSLEIALDVEWAHAIAPAAGIVLVEAKSSRLSDLMAGVDAAVLSGARVVSMSFGGTEFSGESSNDSHFAASHVTFTASSGDSGAGVEYPAASPYVVAVGGTTLTIDASGNYTRETAWSGSGGGLSSMEVEPLYQASFGISNNPGGKRGVPDVAYDGDPNSGFAIFDSVKYQGQSGWFQVGGTSAGSPQWAALIAVVNSIRNAAGKAPLDSANASIYGIATAAYSSNFFDTVSGTNGTCGTLCTASTGYDYVTGLGSPRANSIIVSLANLP